MTSKQHTQKCRFLGQKVDPGVSFTVEMKKTYFRTYLLTHFLN